VSPARAGTRLHPRVAAAAEGELPPWGRAGPARRAHMERVAALLNGWSRRLGLDGGERARWRALAFLHDCLKEAPESSLRPWLEPALADLPAPVIHGPAAAERLAADGVEDRELLDAVRYHTLGHPGLGRAGRALYAADFLEPGRDLRNDWRDGLRARMPGEMDAVVAEIVAARIVHLVEERRPVRPETVAFWNRLVREASGRGDPAAGGRAGETAPGSAPA
jgi:HD superfamily phosphohydrolase YqeK